MLSIEPMGHNWRSDTGGVYLRWMLIGALCAPLAAAVVGRTVATPFGLPLVALGAGTAAAAAVYVARRLRRGRGRAVLRVIVDATVLGLLAAVFAAIAGVRATGFYTQEALADAMAVLLLIHLAGVSLRAVGLRRQRWPRMTMIAAGSDPQIPHASQPASMQFADMLTAGMALLVACFWVLAAIPLHEVAGVSLLLAGFSGAIALIARLPSVLFNERVLLRAWRRSGRLRAHRARGDGADRHGGAHVVHP